MSRKTQLQAVMDKIHSNYKKYNKLVETVKNSEDFTDKYKEELLAAHKAALNEALASLQKDVIKIIEEARKETASEAERAVRKLGKPELQQQFSNTLRIFELTGGSMEAEDVKTMAAPFVGAPTMVKALQVALVKGGRKAGGADSDINKLFPLDTRNAARQTLDDTQGLIDKALKSGHYDGLDGARTGLYFASESMNKLNDDLADVAPQDE